jgi:chromosome partitioning protein
LGEAQSLRQPIIMYDAESKGAVNYLNLAREILQNNGLTALSAEETLPEEQGNNVNENLN